MAALRTVSSYELSLQEDGVVFLIELFELLGGGLGFCERWGGRWEGTAWFRHGKCVSYSVLYPAIFSYVIMLEEEKETTHDTRICFLHSGDCASDLRSPSIQSILKFEGR